MVDNLIPYFHKHFVRVDREVRNHYGVMDLWVAENDTIIEVKRDCSDLHSALGQLLTYQRDVAPSNNRKLVLIYDGYMSDGWHNIFRDFGIETIPYHLMIEGDVPISTFGIYTKNTEFYSLEKATRRHIWGK